MFSLWAGTVWAAQEYVLPALTTTFLLTLGWNIQTERCFVFFWKKVKRKHGERSACPLWNTEILTQEQYQWRSHMKEREETVLLQLTRCFGSAGKQSNDITSHEFLLADYLFANTFCSQDKAGWQMESILWPQMTQKYVGKNTALFLTTASILGEWLLSSTEGSTTQMSRAAIC